MSNQNSLWTEVTTIAPRCQAYCIRNSNHGPCSVDRVCERRLGATTRCGRRLADDFFARQYRYDASDGGLSFVDDNGSPLSYRLLIPIQPLQRALRRYRSNLPGRVVSITASDTERRNRVRNVYYRREVGALTIFRYNLAVRRSECRWRLEMRIRTWWPSISRRH